MSAVEFSHVRPLFTVKQFAEKHRGWSEASLRNLVFQAKPRHTSQGEIAGNGLADAIVRQGRKVLVDECRFFQWLEAQNQAR